MIKIENLFFSYTGSAPYIFQDVSLEIGGGEYISVVGDNGCGKSTLIRLILNFLKPTKGKIVSHSQRIGYVPQKNDFSNTSFPITVYEMLNSYRKLLKIKNKDIVPEILMKVGMSDFSDVLMGTLSGGQNQKVIIARALMGDPDLLILDEPSTGVDINSRKDIYNLIKALNKEKGMTIISVEHNLDAAIANSTSIYHLSGGNGTLYTPENFADNCFSERRKEEHDIVKL